MILAWLWPRSDSHSPRVLSMFDHAIRELDELASDIRGSARHPARGLIADIIEHRDNPHYLTTVFEANAEMKDAADQLRAAE